MNLLDLIPTLRRQIGQYINSEIDTDSTLAGYVADAIDALNWRWIRTYTVTLIPPYTYSVTPDIKSKDVRPIILMAGIIYKMGQTELASFRDGDFSYDPVHVRIDPLTHDLAELKDILPSYPILTPAFTAPLHGFNNVFNAESYQYLFLRLGWSASGPITT